MKNSLRKITLAFLLLAFLPAGYLVYELMSWTRNEKLIHDIYQNQLDAVLFSVNQYSDDIISSWANKINIALSRQAETSPDTLTGLDINSVPLLFLSDGAGQTRFYRLNADSIPAETLQRFAREYQTNERENLEKLSTYFEAGFRKIDPADSLLADRFIPMTFILEKEVRPFRFAIVFLDLDKFISNDLGPRMQTIAGDKFILSAYRNAGNAMVYSSVDPYGIGQAETTGSQDLRKPLWLVPGYDLAIQMKEASLTALVNDRMRTSAIVLATLLIILVSGMVLVYRNIRYQMRLSEAKSEFVSNVSHEIRTPLSLISMYAETLEMNRVPEEKKKEYYEIISKETARLSGIVNRILSFSRMDANKKVYTHSIVDVNQLCGEVLRAYSGHFREKGFTVNFSPAPECGTVEGDKEAISEAFLNLVDNAMKYSRDDKSIWIRTGQREQSTFIEVEDHGIGIPRAYQREIFEQFYRAPMGNVHQTKGSGLGLSIVKKTMEAHRGEVEVESALDKGSKFRLIFPTLNAQ